MPANEKWNPNPDFAEREAMEYVERLGAIPRFPGWSQPSLAAVAEVIVGLCAGPAEAEVMVKAAVRDMDEWTGIPNLKAIHAEVNGRYEAQSWKAEPYWGAIEPACALCNDTGAHQPGSGELFRVCSCASGQDESSKFHVDALNQEIEWGRQNRLRAKQRSAPQGRAKKVNHSDMSEVLSVLDGKAK